MPPHGPIIMASHPKAVIFFYGPLCRSLYPVHIYKSKLSFTLFKSCTWSKVLCTGHWTATSANALTPIKHWQKISSVSGGHIVKKLFLCKKQSNSKHLLLHCILIFKTLTPIFLFPMITYLTGIIHNPPDIMRKNWKENFCWCFTSCNTWGAGHSQNKSPLASALCGHLFPGAFWIGQGPDNKAIHPRTYNLVLSVLLHCTFVNSQHSQQVWCFNH